MRDLEHKQISETASAESTSQHKTLKGEAARLEDELLQTRLELIRLKDMAENPVANIDGGILKALTNIQAVYYNLQKSMDSGLGTLHRGSMIPQNIKKLGLALAQVIQSHPNILVQQDVLETDVAVIDDILPDLENNEGAHNTPITANILLGPPDRSSDQDAPRSSNSATTSNEDLTRPVTRIIRAFPDIGNGPRKRPLTQIQAIEAQNSQSSITPTAQNTLVSILKNPAATSNQAVARRMSLSNPFGLNSSPTERHLSRGRGGKTTYKGRHSRMVEGSVEMPGNTQHLDLIQSSPQNLFGATVVPSSQGEIEKPKPTKPNSRVPLIKTSPYSLRRGRPQFELDQPTNIVPRSKKKVRLSEPLEINEPLMASSIASVSQIDDSQG
jgi:hypothetical protein